MKRILFFLALAGLLGKGGDGFAQTEKDLLNQILEEERNSMDALALYPADTRNDILEASLYPELLIKIESMQQKTMQSFKAILEAYPRETQEMIWDLTRYPDLISRLTIGGQKSGERLYPILADYPGGIHQRAREASDQHFDLLAKVDMLNREWEFSFDRLLVAYPNTTKAAARSLVELPEVLSLLTDNLKMTLILGDLYKRNPAWLESQLDSLGLIAARERTKELEDWKTALEENPVAKEELMASAQNFAASYGFDDAYYDYSDDIYYQPEREVEVVHHYYHHYPYWFGYPYWYMYPRWRPYPWWYDWGFYWSGPNVIVIIDLPSYYFTGWYFDFPMHHRHYPHLSCHFINHYYGHRESSSSMVSGVRNWRQRNREIISEEWIEQARKRPGVLEEYGKFETTRSEYNARHTEKPLTQVDYLEKERKKYPYLQQTAERWHSTGDFKKEVTAPDRKVPMTDVEREHEDEKRVLPPPKPEVREPSTRKLTPQTDKKQPAPLPKVDKARDYHQNKWEQTRKQPDTRQPAVKPEVKRKETPKTQPKSQVKPAPKTKTGSKPAKKNVRNVG